MYTLLQVADFLEEKPADRHNMTKIWCRSASCAIGDVVLFHDHFVLNQNDQQFIVASPPGSYVPGITPVYNYGEYAQKMFGVSIEEAAFLFGAESPEGNWRGEETPQQTAARIRKFVASKQAEQDIVEQEVERELELV